MDTKKTNPMDFLSNIMSNNFIHRTLVSYISR